MNIPTKAPCIPAKKKYDIMIINEPPRNWAKPRNQLSPLPNHDCNVLEKKSNRPSMSTAPTITAKKMESRVKMVARPTAFRILGSLACLKVFKKEEIIYRKKKLRSSNKCKFFPEKRVFKWTKLILHTYKRAWTG